MIMSLLFWGFGGWPVAVHWYFRWWWQIPLRSKKCAQHKVRFYTEIGAVTRHSQCKRGRKRMMIVRWYLNRKACIRFQPQILHAQLRSRNWQCISSWETGSDRQPLHMRGRVGEGWLDLPLHKVRPQHAWQVLMLRLKKPEKKISC